MIVIGLTGATGAGKSTIAARLRRKGWPVFDADKVVHRMQGRGGVAVGMIGQLWPDVIIRGAVDRARLRRHVTQDPQALEKLERIMHPLVKEARKKFLRSMRAAHQRVCVLDIPLLVETNAHEDCNIVIVAEAPLAARMARIHRRGKMTGAEARALLARQATDEARRRVADIVIHTGSSQGDAVRKLKKALFGMGL